MAVMLGDDPVNEFPQWYGSYEVNSQGCLEYRNISDKGNGLWQKFEAYKREVGARLANYAQLEKLADGEVLNPKPDLPNISSGETAGIVRRIARNLVQNCPNVEVISKFDDDDVKGIFARYTLTSKIIGSDQYSNDMQQNLFASTKTALTLGFDTVVPVLLQDASGSWYIKYDTIHYRDVFPEPGCKDVREASDVFIRRYLTRGEVKQLCREQAHGWDHAALYALLKTRPPSRQAESVDKQTSKHRGHAPDGYEVITWYSTSGEAFLTFDASTKMLLRIEKNKHPLKQHPVFFLILEKDALQPFGKSQVELLVGRQDFQDLMLNGAMKLWYRNINPSIIGYGAINAIPNLSPGKYTQIANPNAKIEAFEVNTQTLMQYGQISEQNLGSMVTMVGAADQQMATQSGNGMSATPQGVEAQQQMVDITTNNYQKAIEGFFSHYCSYALTMFFQELQSIKKITPTAEARIRMLKAGLRPYNAEATTDEDKGDFNEKGELEIDFKDLMTEYWVRCVPGSLVEMEDDKQLRVLNQLFVPLSQAMPALAASQSQDVMKNAALTLQFIMEKSIELSGSSSARQLADIWANGDVGRARDTDERIRAVESKAEEAATVNQEELEVTSAGVVALQEQINVLTETTKLILEKLGVPNEPSETSSPATPVAV